MINLSVFVYITAFSPEVGSVRPVGVKGICGHPTHSNDPHWMCVGCRTRPVSVLSKIHLCQTVQVDMIDGSTAVRKASPPAECLQCVLLTSHDRLLWLKPGMLNLSSQVRTANSETATYCQSSGATLFLCSSYSTARGVW